MNWCLTGSTSLILSVSAANVAGDQRTAFLSESRDWLPSQAIVVTEHAVGEAAGMMRAGFDPSTGAWFLATTASVGGRDENGVAFYMTMGQSQPETPKYRPLPYFVGTIVPGAIIASIHEDPEILIEADRQADSWFATYQLTVDATKTPPQTMTYIAEFDAASGRLRSIERDHPSDRQRVEFDQSDPDLDRRVYPASAPQYRYTVDQPQSAGAFSQRTVLPQMQELKIAVDQRFAVITAGFIENDDGELVPSPASAASVAYAESQFRKLRLPLFLVGGLLVAAAAATWYRRRAA